MKFGEKTEPTDEELAELDDGKDNEIDYEELRRIIALQNSMSDNRYVKMIEE